MVTLAAANLVWGCADNGKFEVVERTDKRVENFEAPGSHGAVDYVLLNAGHRFYAECDYHTVDVLDPSANCGLRILKKYSCRLGEQPRDKAASDLLCDDPEGHVYLYVSKKD